MTTNDTLNPDQLLVVDGVLGLTIAPSKTPLTRLRYFDGKFLRASDLELEQNAQRRHVELSNRAGGFGIVFGFDTDIVPGDKLRVDAGQAIDPLGRVLLLPNGVEVAIDQLISRSQPSTPSPNAKNNADPDSGEFKDAPPEALPPIVVGDEAPDAPKVEAKLWLITVAHAEFLCGEEDVFGKLCEQACVNSTERSFRIEGVVLRARPFTTPIPPLLSSSVTITDEHLRSRVASAVFASQRSTPASLISGTGLRNLAWCHGAEALSVEAEVPLGVLRRQGTVNLFFDAWSVRRERMDGPPRDYWANRMAMRPWRNYLAEILQFQCQLAELLLRLGDDTPVVVPCAAEKETIEAARKQVAALRDQLGALDPQNVFEVLAALNKIESTLGPAAPPGQVSTGERVLIDGGIVELPPAGYLPVNPTGGTVNEQVRRLLGDGVDLNFCIIRPDDAARELEGAQHLDRITLLRGLDLPDQKPPVDILVPDGLILEGERKVEGLAYRATLGLGAAPNAFNENDSAFAAINTAVQGTNARLRGVGRAARSLAGGGAVHIAALLSPQSPLDVSELALLNETPNARKLLEANLPAPVQPEEELKPFELTRTLQHDAAVTSVAWAPDNSRIAAVDRNRIRFWSLDGAVQLDFGGAHRLQWRPDSTLLGSSFSQGVEVGASNIWTLQGINNRFSGASNAVAWSPDGKLIAAGLFGIVVHDAAGVHQFNLFEPGIPIVTALAWSAKQQILVSGHSDGKIVVWDTIKRSVINTIQRGNQSIESLSWAPDASRFASASQDGSWFVHRPDGESIELLNEDGSALAAAWSPDGKLLLTAGTRGRIRVWDPDTRTQLEQLEHGGAVTALSWAPSSRQFASSGLDNTVKIWARPVAQPLPQPSIEQAAVWLDMSIADNPFTVALGKSFGASFEQRTIINGQLGAYQLVGQILITSRAPAPSGQVAIGRFNGFESRSTASGNVSAKSEFEIRVFDHSGNGNLDGLVINLTPIKALLDSDVAVAFNGTTLDASGLWLFHELPTEENDDSVPARNLLATGLDRDDAVLAPGDPDHLAALQALQSIADALADQGFAQQAADKLFPPVVLQLSDVLTIEAKHDWVLFHARHRRQCAKPQVPLPLPGPGPVPVPGPGPAPVPAPGIPFTVLFTSGLQQGPLDVILRSQSVAFAGRFEFPVDSNTPTQSTLAPNPRANFPGFGFFSASVFVRQSDAGLPNAQRLAEQAFAAAKATGYDRSPLGFEPNVMAEDWNVNDFGRVIVVVFLAIG